MPQAKGALRPRGMWLAFVVLVLAMAACVVAVSPARARPATVRAGSEVPCGSLSFGPPTNYPTARTPRSAAGGDFNHDGHQDAAVTNYSGNNVSVLLGNADGSFQPAVNYLAGVNPVGVAVGDLNGDTFPDLVLANYNSSSISILPGNGDGTFQGGGTYSSGIGPYGVTLGDFNGDSHLDVAVSNVNFGVINIMLGNGNGTVQPPTSYPAGTRPQVIATADFNGDGKLDLAVPNYNVTTVSVLRGNGDGSFQAPVTYTVTAGPDYLTLADLNGDGHADIITSHYSDNLVSVLLGNADGSFQPAVTYPTGGANPLFVAVADFDGDGTLDLGAVNYGGNSIGFLLGNGDGTFRPVVNIPTGAGTSPVALVPGDFNADGRLDMLVANEAGGNASVFLSTCEQGTGTPTSTPTNTPGPPTTTGTPMSTLTATSTATNTPAVTATGTTTPCALSFSDVHPTDYFYTPVLYLACHGAISGYGDGSFRPYNDTTRGQLSKIVVLAEGFPLNTAGGPHFTDVPTTNPFYVFIETAYNRGLVSGYSDGTFRWGNNVTRGQLSKIVVAAEGWPIDTTGGPHFTDVPTTNPFYGFVETAYNRGIISGYSDGTFRPGNNATRGQISKIVYQAVTQP